MSISNCGHDENGKYTGGVAGDQTGTEWAVIEWYNRPWNCVLRHPDSNIRAKIAELAIAAAKNNKIGYDQGQRDTFWKQLQKVNYDPSEITIACETDCSSGIISITKAVGYLLNIALLQKLSATYTGNMRAAYKAAGFEVLTDNKYLTSDAYLLRGDILLNDSVHTATNLTDGSKVSIESTGTTRAYTVTRGDTLSGIGAELGVDWKEIAALNGISDPYTIIVGQVLKIPTSTSTSSTKVTISVEPVFAQYFNKMLAGIYTINTQKDPLTMRTDAGTDKVQITTIPKGAKVQCYGYYNKSGSTKWLLVQYNKQTGYCCSSYLQKK